MKRRSIFVASVLAMVVAVIATTFSVNTQMSKADIIQPNPLEAIVNLKLIDKDKNPVREEGFEITIFRVPENQNMGKIVTDDIGMGSMKLPAGKYKCILTKGNDKYKVYDANTFETNGKTLLMMGAHKSFDFVLDSADGTATKAVGTEQPKATDTGSVIFSASSVGTHVFPNLNVTFTHKVTGDVIRKTTDKKGEIKLNDIPVGDYTVKILNNPTDFNIDKLKDLTIEKDKKKTYLAFYTPVQYPVVIQPTIDGNLVKESVYIEVKGLDELNSYINFKGDEGHLPNMGSTFWLPKGNYSIKVVSGVPTGKVIENAGMLKLRVTGDGKHVLNFITGTTKPTTPVDPKDTEKPKEPKPTTPVEPKPTTPVDPKDTEKPKDPKDTSNPITPETPKDNSNPAEPTEPKVGESSSTGNEGITQNSEDNKETTDPSASLDKDTEIAENNKAVDNTPSSSSTVVGIETINQPSNGKGNNAPKTSSMERDYKVLNSGILLLGVSALGILLYIRKK